MRLCEDCLGELRPFLEARPSRKGEPFITTPAPAFHLSSPRCGRSYLNRTVVITMPLMRIVEMTSYEVVRMIAVGNRFMPAVWAVPVSGFVTAAGASRIAFRRIGGIHFQLVFVHVVAMHKVHVPIVKETLMPFVH